MCPFSLPLKSTTPFTTSVPVTSTLSVISTGMPFCVSSQLSPRNSRAAFVAFNFCTESLPTYSVSVFLCPCTENQTLFFCSSFRSISMESRARKKPPAVALSLNEIVLAMTFALVSVERPRMKILSALMRHSLHLESPCITTVAQRSSSGRASVPSKMQLCLLNVVSKDLRLSSG